MNNKNMGVHVLIELFDCPKEKLEYLEVVKGIVLEIVNEANLSKIGEGFHQFSPTGVTGFILLGESHLSVHTWPEHSSVAMDIFCCYLNKKNMEIAIQKAEKAAKLAIKKFRPKKFDKKVIIR